MNYRQHVRELTLVDSAIDSLHSAYRWLFWLVIIWGGIIGYSYFQIEAANEAVWMESNLNITSTLSLAAIVYIFLSFSFFAWSIKRNIRRSGQKNFFKGLGKILLSIFAAPFVIMPLAGVYYAFYFLINTYIIAL